MSEDTQAVNQGADTTVKTPSGSTKKSKEQKNVDKKQSALKKLDSETVKLLQSLREKANKKEFGRKIRDNEIIHLGLALIASEHIEDLKERSYSEQDRLRFAHLEHQKNHGKITFDQFIGKLIRGEIPPVVKS